MDDVRQTANLLAKSDKYDHLLLFAHGGLNSITASARRIAAMKETFKENRIYPYHFMYDTGLLEEIKDVVVGKNREATERAGGLSDWTDKIIEHATRISGRALWRQMKMGSRKPFEADTVEDVRKAQAHPDVKATPMKRYNPDVPRALERIVSKCLAKVPDNRYPSVSLVINHLEAIL